MLNQLTKKVVNNYRLYYGKIILSLFYIFGLNMLLMSINIKYEIFNFSHQKNFLHFLVLDVNEVTLAPAMSHFLTTMMSNNLSPTLNWYLSGYWTPKSTHITSNFLMNKMPNHLILCHYSNSNYGMIV